MAEKKRSEFANFMIGWRMMNNMSQTELGLQTDTTRSAIGHIEVDKFERPMKFIRRFAQLLNASEKKKLKEVLLREYEKELDFL